MWKRVIFVALIYLVVGSQPSKAGLDVKLPIDKVTEGIVDFVKWLLTQSRTDSVGTLVKDLGSLSGKESTLADDIAKLARNRKGMGGAPATKMLNNRLAEIYSKYLVVQQHFKDLDPQWAGPHAGLVGDIGAFAHDGFLWYCPVSEGCEDGGGGQQTIDLSDDGIALANQLRSDVAKMNDLINKSQIAQQASSGK